MQTFFSITPQILYHYAPVSSAMNELQLFCFPSDAGGGPLPSPPPPLREITNNQPTEEWGPGFKGPRNSQALSAMHTSDGSAGVPAAPGSPCEPPAELARLSYSSPPLLSKKVALFFPEDIRLNLYGMRRLGSYAHTFSILKQVMRTFSFFPTLRF